MDTTERDTVAINREKKKKKKKKNKRKNHDKRSLIDVGTEDESTPKRQKLDFTKALSSVVKKSSSQNAQDGLVPLKRNKKQKREKDRRVQKPAAGDINNLYHEQDIKDKHDSSDVDLATASFPFPTDPDDHCESPLIAYAHIQPLLLHIQSANHHFESKNALSIYDPYYCNGTVVQNLKALGFPNVYNKKEDCYQIWSSPTSYPTFDVLLTNPPYSLDHVEKLIRHVTAPRMKQRPWFLLMPEWVHKKDYFVEQMKRNQLQPFFLVPKKRYVYLPPKHFRETKKSDVHKKSSPFNSMWYVWGGTKEQNDRLIHHYYNKCTFPMTVNSSDETAFVSKQMVLMEEVDLARSKNALRDLRRKHKK